MTTHRFTLRGTFRTADGDTQSFVREVVARDEDEARRLAVAETELKQPGASHILIGGISIDGVKAA